MKKLLPLIFLIFSVLAHTQGDQPPHSERWQQNGSEQIPSEVKTILSDFFDGLQERNVPESYRNLLKNSPILDKEEELKNLIVQTNRSLDLYGKIKSFDFVEFDSVTESYFKTKFLANQEKLPTRWMFTFYKSPVRGWIVTNVQFDDLAEFFFEE